MHLGIFDILVKNNRLLFFMDISVPRVPLKKHMISIF